MFFKLVLLCLYISLYGVNTEPENKCNALMRLFRTKEACTAEKSPYNPDKYLNVVSIITVESLKLFGI